MTGEQFVRELGDLAVDSIIQLYVKHFDALRAVREEQRELYERGMKAQLDDIEAELTYLLIREHRPETVVEVGALQGWSTTWILQALRDNDAGRLITMDLLADAAFIVPTSLAGDRWTFRRGDVRTLPRDWVRAADHLFIDAAHGASFARWYLAEVFPELLPGTLVSVHDVFHRRLPFPRSEGAVVLDWLARSDIDYLTTSRSAARDVYERISRFKRRAGLGERIHPTERNPMIFFSMSDPT